MSTGPQGHSDRRLLEMLHARDHLGMSANEIALRFGMTRSAVLGVFKRIRDEADAVGNADHLDGTMPATWWKAGLARRTGGDHAAD